MKRTFTLILGLTAAIWSGAQQKHGVNGNHLRHVTPRVATASESHQSLDQGAANLQILASKNRGTSIFSEDFANGFDGNNPFGEWTHEDSGNNSIWMMADAASPAGFYSDVADALASTTTDNGWVIFDCDLYQAGEISATNPAEDVTGYLTSPVINMTDMPSVILEFQQCFRYCCFDALPLVVEVTNDGGNNWFVFNGAPSFNLGANEISENPLVTAIDISGVAAGQGAVQFRFGWQPNGNSTHSHYFWGIDDVNIYENPVENDVVASYVSNGNIVTSFEYRAIPLEQAISAADGGIVVGTIFSNLGTNAHTASFKVEILDEAMVSIAADSLDFTILPNALLPDPSDPNDTLFIPTNWEPTATGTYYARTTIRFPEVDDTPANNTMMKKFFVTDCEYGHDDPALINSEMVPIAGAGTATDPFPPTGFGSYVGAVNEGSTAYGMMVRFDNSADTNTPITILLLKQAEDYNLTDAEFVTGAEFDIDADWTPSGSGTIPYYLPFDDEASLDAGSLYFTGVQVIDEGTDQLSVQAIAEPDLDFSTGTWAETTEGDFIWFFGIGSLTDFTPAIRLVLCEYVGVEERQAKVGLDSFTISPNPAVNQTRVNFDLKGSRYVAYEVRDVTGKLVEYKNIGQFSPGQNSFTLDVSAYPAGNYMVNLVIDGEYLFTNQMNVAK